MVADEDCQFPAFVGQPQPDDGTDEASRGVDRVRDQLAHDKLGFAYQGVQPPFPDDLPGPCPGAAGAVRTAPSSREACAAAGALAETLKTESVVMDRTTSFPGVPGIGADVPWYPILHRA
jgi:hypothetical protein